MRTTVTLEDELVRQAKVVAAESGQSFSEVLEDALREKLTRRRASPKRLRKLPTFRGRGAAPGVDLSDNAATRAFELEWEIKDRPERFPWLPGRES